MHAPPEPQRQNILSSPAPSGYEGYARQDLLRWMDVAEKRLNEGYAGAPVAQLQRRFADARLKLEARVKKVALRRPLNGNGRGEKSTPA